jgi:RNA recognition motif-containing protein
MMRSTASGINMNDKNQFMSKRSDCSIIMRDLSFFCNENHLKEIVSCYGQCLKVHICRSEESNHRSLLHAFVEMTSDESVQDLIEELNGVLFMGRQMK